MEQLQFGAVKINCHSLGCERTTVALVITNQTTTRKVVTMVLDKCHIVTDDVSKYCLVMEIVPKTKTKGSTINSLILDEYAYPYVLQEKNKAHYSTRLIIHEKLGTLVDIYDGRLWPVVLCGNVYVNSCDNTQQLLQDILAVAPISNQKRPSKYTLAVGTSRGHIHSFLQDTEHPLTALEKQTDQDDQCLMIIKKPKGGTKQMLKSQSLSNLSASDSQRCRLDGAYQTDNRKHRKYRMKKKLHHRLSLDGDGLLKEGEDNHTPDSSPEAHYKSTIQEVRERLENLDIGDPVIPADDLRDHHQQKAEDYDCVDAEKEARCFRDVSHSLYKNYREVNNNEKSTAVCGLKGYTSFTNLSVVPSSSDSDSDGKRKCKQTISNKPLEKYIKPKNREPVSRCHSLGDLSTGLSLSLVGWQNASSKQSVSVESNEKDSRSTPRYLLKNRQDSFNNSHQDVSRTANHSDSSTNKCQDSLTRNDQDHCLNNGHNGVSSDAYSYVTNGHQHKLTNICEDGFVDHTVVSPDSGGSQTRPESQTSVNTVSSYAGSERRRSQKGRRALPQLPSGDVNEKRRRYAELMRKRILLYSSASCRSSVTAVSPMPSQSRVDNHSLIGDTPADIEVSNLLRDYVEETELSPPALPDDVFPSKFNEFPKPSHLAKPTPCNKDSQDFEFIVRESSTPVQPGDVVNGYSGERTASHSSTMDSGYNTNDGESETYTNAQRLKLNPQKVQNLSVGKKHITKYAAGNLNTCLKARSSNSLNMGWRNQKPAEIISKLSKSQTSLNTISRVPEKTTRAPVTQTSSSVRKPPRELSNAVLKRTKSAPSHNPMADKRLDAKKFVKPSKFDRISEDRLKDNVVNSNEDSNTLKAVNGVSKKRSFSEETKIPSLFQLLQKYDLLPLKLNLPDNISLNKYIALDKCSIALPTDGTSSRGTSPNTSGPQGLYAKIGGPGSAFRRVQSTQRDEVKFTMVAVSQVDSDWHQTCDHPVMPGDVIIEINGLLKTDCDLISIQQDTKLCRGHVTVTVARAKPANEKLTAQCSGDSMMQVSDNVAQSVHRLEAEVQKRDLMIRRLMSLVPLNDNNRTDARKNDMMYERQVTNHYTHLKNTALYNAQIGEDEFIV